MTAMISMAAAALQGSRADGGIGIAIVGMATVFFGLVVLLAWALDRPLDWSRLAGIAALIAAVAASLSSYRTTKREMRKDEDQE